MPRAGLLRGGPTTPHPTPNPHIRTEVTILPKNLWRRRKREERGPEGWDPCHARVQARPSTARWRHTAGVAARRLFGRVVDTLFSMTYLGLLRSLFALIDTGNGLHAARGVLRDTYQ